MPCFVSQTILCLPVGSLTLKIISDPPAPILDQKSDEEMPV